MGSASASQLAKLMSAFLNILLIIEVARKRFDSRTQHHDSILTPTVAPLAGDPLLLHIGLPAAVVFDQKYEALIESKSSWQWKKKKKKSILL